MKSIIIVQVLLFVLGVILLIVDGSGGYVANMTWLSHLGIVSCILGIGLYHIGGLIGNIITKLKNKKGGK